MSSIESVQLFAAGSCWQKEAFSIRGGEWKDVEFPAMCAVFRHPEIGWILYDTGYDPDIYSSGRGVATRLYARVMKVNVSPATSVASRLRELGIEPEEIKWVVLSHFHPDHIGGARLFPNARFLCSRNGYEEACARSRRLGFHRKLLPVDFESRCEFVEDRTVASYPQLEAFGPVYDVIGDGSVLSVLIDGHAPRQLACLVGGEEQSCFLLADSAWSRRAIDEDLPPHGLTRLIQDDWRSLRRNLSLLSKLSKENPSWKMVPSHCRDSLKEGVYHLGKE